MPCMEVWYLQERQSYCGCVRHHAEVVVSRSNLGCCIPLYGFLAVIQLVRYWGHKAE
jgi:hypothetical protein